VLCELLAEGKVENRGLIGNDSGSDKKMMTRAKLEEG
jgi:hypothetical protein